MCLTLLTIVRDLPVGDREVDTSLEDSGCGAGVTVDTNPSRGSTVGARRGRDSKGTSHSGESSLSEKSMRLEIIVD